MKFYAVWPITNPTLTDSELITEGKGRLHEVRPFGYSFQAARWRIEQGWVIFEADAEHTAEHGTDRGYHQHVKLTRTPACDPCKAAHNAHQKHWVANRGKPRVRSERPKSIPCACGAPSTVGRCRSCANRARNHEYQARLRIEREAAEKALAEAEWKPVRWIRRGLIWIAVDVPRDEEAA